MDKTFTITSKFDIRNEYTILKAVIYTYLMVLLIKWSIVDSKYQDDSSGAPVMCGDVYKQCLFCLFLLKSCNSTEFVALLPQFTKEEPETGGG